MRRRLKMQNAPKEKDSIFSSLQILTGPKKGRSLRLLSSQITMGRSSKCDLIFKDDTLCSHEHVLFYKQGFSYVVKSLDPKNPVLVNNKSIDEKVLKPKDELQIGKMKLRFFQNKTSELKTLRPAASLKKTKKKLPFSRLLLILLLLGMGFLFFREDSSKTAEDRKIKLKTEQDVFNQVEDLKKQLDKDLEDLSLSFKQKGARAAFISGFRDYRKGYYKRALKMFKHCSLLDKVNPLCRRYELKSISQIEKLIQEKIRVGNAYIEKKQYAACEAVFRSVKIMVEDTNSPIYKEAQLKFSSCSIRLKNRI